MIDFSVLYPRDLFIEGVAASFSFADHRAHADGPFAAAFASKLRSLHADGTIEPVASCTDATLPETDEWNDFARTGEPSPSFVAILGRDLIAHAMLDVDINDPHLKKDIRLARAHERLCATVDTGSTTDIWRFDRLRDPASGRRLHLRLAAWKAHLEPFSSSALSPSDVSSGLPATPERRLRRTRREEHAMSITISRTTTMSEHRQIDLPQANVAAVVAAIRAAGLDPFYAELPEETDGLLVHDLAIDAVGAALINLTLSEATTAALREIFAHALKNAGNAISFVQYREGGALAIGSHPDAAGEMSLANGNAFALFDALGMRLDGYCGQFRAADLLAAARNLSLASDVGRYRGRLIAICEHAIARNGADAMMTAA